MTARPIALAASALVCGGAGCLLAAATSPRPPPEREAAQPAPPPTAEAFDPGVRPKSAHRNESAAENGRPGREREWTLASAPAAVVAVVRAERRAVSPENDVVSLSATPVDLDSDGAPEWVVAAETEFPAMVNVPLWAFAERRGVWANLGFLGAGFDVKPAGVPRRGYAPLCVVGRDGPDHVATEFAWGGTCYRAGARYVPRRVGGRPCDGADGDAP